MAQPPRALAKWLGPQLWEKDVAGPIISLGAAGQFDDMHIFAPAVIEEKGRYLLWYCGSRGTRATRVFRLGLATSKDGKAFERHPQNPVLEFDDGILSVLTPALLRQGDGAVVRENGKLRMWHSAANLAKGGLHTLHETTSADGIDWAKPSPPLLDHVYCPTVLKSERGYDMWYSDVSKRPWVIRHAASADGRAWKVTDRPVLQLSQEWEAEVLVYPTVLKIDGVYLMWYGSYYSAVRRQTTAVGFAVSLDGLHWHKHPQNPVLIPDPKRPWESNYVGSGCVARLADGSFRYWYASRKAPPFENLYFAINTARWAGPTAPLPQLPLPPKKGDKGILSSSPPSGEGLGVKGAILVLEVVGKRDAIVRVWHPTAPTPSDAAAADLTFIDLWVHGIDTSQLTAGSKTRLPHVFHVTGNKLFETTCGKRSLPLLEPVDGAEKD
ncbi:MAG: hypothetical protein L0211_03265 [Planctomycetaceae bacterium]|nr:hypothetical protein [Planctomycetaceae bacterium]